MERCFRAALARVAAGPAVERLLDRGGTSLTLDGRPVTGRVFALAAGKAALPMAAAVEAWAGERLAAGLCVTKEGHGGTLGRSRVLETAHPVPDVRSVAAGHEALALAERVGEEDTLVVLLSGGASSLWSAPLPGLTLDDLGSVTSSLMSAGADIEALNTVRKHLTAVSGGRLARATRAGRVEVLALSDVPGDDPAVLASGPCAGDSSRFGDALAVLEERNLTARIPPAVRAHLEAGRAGRIEESVAPGDPCLERVRFTSLGNNEDACAAASAEAERADCDVQRYEPGLYGEARDVGRNLVRAARQLSAERGTVLVAGGETTVTVTGGGKGGRNQELALAAALELSGKTGVTLLAAGTDGTDGPTDMAGAFADGETVVRAKAVGVSAAEALAANDSYRLFAAEGGHLHTGPTGTNVMDLALVHIAGRSG